MRGIQAVVLFLALGSISLGIASAAPDDEMEQRIRAQMERTDRHQYDLPRDEHRKPYETFIFLGLEEGMTVLDVGAYAGYTSEMLSAAVGPAGKVHAHNTERVFYEFAEGYYQRAMEERLANGRLPNVSMLLAPYGDLGLDGSVDVAFLGNLLHDFYYRDGRDEAIAYLKSVAKTLKPGGVIGIMDHVGVSGQDNKALHRIGPRLARELIAEAGLYVEAETDLFANDQDPHTTHVYDDSIYRRTDRFLFRVVRP